MANGKRGRPSNAGKVFDSIKGAAAFLKVDVEDLAAARSAGCTAFRSGGKIYIEELLEWLKSNPLEAVEGERETEATLKKRRLRAQCAKLEFDLEEARNLYAPKAEVREKIAGLVAEISAEFRRVFERELPPILEGLGAAEIQSKHGAALDGIFARLRSKADQCAG